MRRRPSRGEHLAVQRLTWVGHATVLVEMDGARLLTDPVLRSRLIHLRRYAEAPAPEVSRAVDAVLLSHLHADHLDPPSLRSLAHDATLVGPRGAGRALRRLGFSTTVELAPGESVPVGEVTVTAVPAVHDGHRWPGGRASEPVGFVISGERRVYFAGDTDIFDAMRELATPELDVALLPVWGWGPSLGSGHMDPAAAARAAALLRPRVAVPIHWGTLFPIGLARRHAELLVDPPRTFARHVAELAPDVRVEILKPGASLDLTVPVAG
jgi:L-ascorbate metabolism protein UlaG (beta-lactamase superfamily)